jgi:predicted GNAT family acetyltransferase
VPSALELCEDSVLHIPPRRELQAVIAAGYVCVPRGPGGSLVQHIRLADAGEVHAAVEQTRAIAREAERSRVTWWVGELSTPDDIVDLLAAEGLVPDADEPLLGSLVLEREPRGKPPDVEAFRVETLDDFLAAQEIDLITMGVAQAERESRRDRQVALWDELRSDGVIATFLLRAGGRPVAFARSAHGDAGVALIGGGTLETERGNGYYTALVHARWRDAVERGTPLLCSQAGKLSRPILEALGFESLGEIRVLVDRL